ncbi:MAG: putative PDDEXK endonuclease, partial [Janthinobacterium lividum]
MPNASKTKGNAAELALCGILSQHLGGSFVRVPNSGAFVGGTNASRTASLSPAQVRAARGDIVPPDHLHHLVIESKAYAALPWHQVIAGS